jgi:outer membrane protein OmpA-like peptidoglycan-associated protein
LAVAGQLQPGGVNRMQFGGEYNFNSVIALRGGYQFNYPNNDLRGMTNFTTGIGLKLTHHIQLDYAFVPEGELGEEHRIGLIYKFGCPEPAAVMKTAEPKPAPAPQPEAIVPDAKETVIVLVLQDTHFDFDKSTLSPEAKAMLDTSIQTLKENPRTSVRLAGYTSARGTEDYNQKLSERRANAVRNYLVQGGIAPDRMTIIGYGKARPAEFEVNPKDINSNAAKANMRTLFEIVVK